MSKKGGFFQRSWVKSLGVSCGSGDKNTVGGGGNRARLIHWHGVLG